MPMKILSRLFALLAIFLASTAPGSTLWDDAYSYKHVVAAVVNADAEPVYGEQVERAMADYLRHNPRFEFSNAGYLKLKEKLKTLSATPTLGDPGEEKVAPILPLFNDLVSMKVRAAVLAEVRHSASSDSYLIFFVLMTTGPAQVTLSLLVPVEDSKILDSFTRAAEQGIRQLLRTIPLMGPSSVAWGIPSSLIEGTPLFDPECVSPFSASNLRRHLYVSNRWAPSW